MGCDGQTIRNAIHAFNERGLECLKEGSSRPHTIHAAFQGERLEKLRAMLHTSPRAFDKPASLCTLELATEVSFEQGISPERVTGETIRATLARLNVHWQRAKNWITSPDPEHDRKEACPTG